MRICVFFEMRALSLGDSGADVGLFLRVIFFEDCPFGVDDAAGGHC